MKTTLEDIALASSVSKATVSYVLNNKRSSLGLSEQTIAKVLNVSRELNYRPDLVAVALSELKNVPLSLLILSPWLHSQFSDFMVQVSRVLEANTLSMRLKPTYELYQSGNLRKVLRPARSQKFNAVIVIGTSDEDDAFLRKNREKFPNVVLLNREVEGYACALGNDYEASAELARRIASAEYYERYVIFNSGKISDCEQKRIDGFRDILENAGVRDVRIYDGSCSISPAEYPEQLFAQFFKEKTLYFIPQYYQAACFLKYLQKKNIAVPKSAGVAAYDSHSLLTDFLSPSLTTIDPKIGEMTLTALQLAKGIKEGKNVSCAVVKSVFVPGESAVYL